MTTGPAPARWLFCDLDGTLADSLGVLRQVYTEFLRQRGATPSDAEFASLNGPELREIVDRLRGNHGWSTSVEDLLAAYTEDLQKAYAAVRPMAGAEALLAQALATGWQLGLVTAASRAVAEAFLTTQGWRFAVIASGDEVDHAKPAPDLYRLALSRAGVGADAALALEDSPHGVTAARAAGLPVWQVGSPAWPDLTAVARRLASVQLPLTTPGATWLAHGEVQAEQVAQEAVAELDAVSVQRAWEAAVAQRPGLFDGLCTHVSAVTTESPRRLTLQPVRYRHILAQRCAGRDLGLRSLAVSALVVDQRGRVLVGQRNAIVTDYANAWETVPSGGVDARQGAGPVDLEGQVWAELAEETGLRPPAPTDTIPTQTSPSASPTALVPMGLLDDHAHFVVDAAFALRVPTSAVQASEHHELRWLTASEAEALPLIPTARLLLMAARLHPEVAPWLDPN
jgi:HAD superfamily hydrolase (TIGR01509 family)